MLSPFHGFEVRNQEGHLIESFELSVLPYVNHIFKVNNLEFKIENVINGGWIVRKTLPVQ